MATITVSFPANEVAEAGRAYFRQYAQDINEVLLRDIAECIIQRFQRHISTSLSAPQGSKRKPINAWGILNEAVSDPSSWEVDINDNGAFVSFTPLGDPEAEVKFRTLAFGSKAMAVGAQDEGGTGSTGIFRQNIQEWVEAKGFTSQAGNELSEKGVSRLVINIAKHIAEYGITPADPSAGFAGQHKNDIFEATQSDSMPFTRLSAKGIVLVRECIKEVLSKVKPVERLKKSIKFKGTRGKPDISMSTIMTLRGEVVRQTRYRGGKPYPFLMAVTRNKLGQFSSILATHSGVVQA